MAKNGDKKAKEVLNQLLDVAERLGTREYFEERIRPVLVASTKNAVGKGVTVNGVTVEITGSMMKWVQFKDADKACRPAELCRPKVMIEYTHSGGEGEFTAMWGVLEKTKIYANVWTKTLDKAAALAAIAVWEGDEEGVKKLANKAKRGVVVTLTPDNLLAMAQYNKDLLEWAMRVKKRGE